MPAQTPLGATLPGLARLGDGAYTFRIPLSHAFSLTYQVANSQYQQPMSIQYTVEHTGVAPLFLYYQVMPPTLFSINGQTGFVRPDHMSYLPYPVVGHTILGASLLQGYRQMTWSYAVLRISEYQQLLAFYNPQQPRVLVTYPDENGSWQQRMLVMRPPTFGSQQMQMMLDVVLTFLIPSSSS